MICEICDAPLERDPVLLRPIPCDCEVTHGV